MDKVYPSWRYSKDGRNCIVDSAEADAALGSGWGENPLGPFTEEAPAEPAEETEQDADIEAADAEVEKDSELLTAAQKKAAYARARRAAKKAQASEPATETVA